MRSDRGLVTAINLVRRAFDVNSFARSQLWPASTPDGSRASRRQRQGLVQLEPGSCARQGLEPPPSVANFLFAEVGEDSRPLFEQLLRGRDRPPGGASARVRSASRSARPTRTSSSATLSDEFSAP
jgi:histidinol-phosphate/aromatic aminotransferase/cobyric acid decarboxylase-like protein